MNKKLFAMMLLAGGTMFGQFSVGINIGPPPAPRYVRVQPARPGPDYTFVDGYWYPEGRRYKWHAGYWTRPPYQGAVWVNPRHDGQQFYAGYWKGENHEPMGHDHRWDRGHDRDWRDHDGR